MTSSLVPTEKEIDTLRLQIQDAKRLEEYAQLRNDLETITARAINTPNEFEGGMQMPDTEKVLHTKRKAPNLVELVLARIKAMLSPRPVIGNLIAIGLAIAALVFLKTEVTLAHFGKYQHYIGFGLLIFAGLQIIKSSTRSLFLPILATVAGAIISHTLEHTQTLFTYHATFYQYLMIVGIIGLGISVLTID